MGTWFDVIIYQVQVGSTHLFYLAVKQLLPDCPAMQLSARNGERNENESAGSQILIHSTRNFRKSLHLSIFDIRR